MTTIRQKIRDDVAATKRQLAWVREQGLIYVAGYGASYSISFADVCIERFLDGLKKGWEGSEWMR